MEMAVLLAEVNKMLKEICSGLWAGKANEWWDFLYRRILKS